MRLARTQSPPTPGVLPARTTALPNHKTESARQSLRSPISDTTTKFHKLNLRPTITATPKSPPSVDVLRQHEADEMFHRVILSLPKRFAEAVSNSGSFRRLIRHLISPGCLDTDHRKGTSAMKEFMNYRLFEGISKQTYEAIAYLVRERGCFPKKPKLTYNPSDAILIVEMPRSIHEWPLTDFRESVSSIVKGIPWDSFMMRVSVEMNYPLASLKTGYRSNPDLTVQLDSLSDSEVSQVVVLLECAFTQDRDLLWEKFRKAINTHPELLVVVAIMVTETPSYQSPKVDTDAWNQFAEEDECRDSSSFLALKKLDTGVADPQSITVDIADHVWCNITSVDYYVWVKNDDGEKLNIDREHTAHGSLFPSIEMEEVTTALGTGFRKVRDSIVSLVRKGDPAANTEELENADVSFRVKWPHVQRGLVRAASLTAHERYSEWFTTRCHGQKRPRSGDEDYTDNAGSRSNTDTPDSPSSHSSPLRRITRSTTRARSRKSPPRYSPPLRRTTRSPPRYSPPLRRTTRSTTRSRKAAKLG